MTLDELLTEEEAVSSVIAEIDASGQKTVEFQSSKESLEVFRPKDLETLLQLTAQGQWLLKRAII